jgi:hypothetical protein
LDDAPTPLGVTGDIGYRQSNLIPIRMDYSNTGFDTRQRFTFNGFYDVPFGVGRQFLNHPGVLDYVIGGWSANATFVAQTGNWFSVTPTGMTVASGYSNYSAFKVGDPFAAGGTFKSPDPALAASITCPTKTRNRASWFNPCSFENPWNSNDFANEPSHYLSTGPGDKNVPKSTPDYVTSTADAINYIGGKRNTVLGPGYERVNMSIFKDFKTFHEESLQFRADIFNLFNTPSLADPSNNSSKPNISDSGAAITAPRSLQHLSPDSRFFQLSLKYSF